MQRKIVNLTLSSDLDERTEYSIWRRTQIGSRHESERLLYVVHFLDYSLSRRVLEAGVRLFVGELLNLACGCR